MVALSCFHTANQHKGHGCTGPANVCFTPRDARYTIEYLSCQLYMLVSIEAIT